MLVAETSGLDFALLIERRKKASNRLHASPILIDSPQLMANRLHPSVTAAIGALFFSACQPVGPDHQVPAMKLPSSFSAGGVRWNQESAKSQPRPRAWWRLYNDSTLNQLVERALANNQEIAASAARLEQARSLSRVARSRYFPGITFNPSLSRSQAAPRGEASGAAFLSTTYSLPIDLSYELDLWGRVRRQVEGARASEGAAEETLSAIRLSVAAEVAQTYWALRAVDADRALLAQTVELRRRALGLLTDQRDAGAISGLDLSRAETEVASAESERIGLDRDRVELVNALAVLTGSAATGSTIPETTALPSPPAIPVSVPSELLRQRPDIRAAERRVAAANAEIGVATAAFYPSLTLGASAGFESRSFSKLFDSNSLIWSIGPNVSLPISGQKLLRAQRDATVAAHEAASAEYRQIVLEAMREVENALQGGAILANRQAAQERASASARRTFELSNQRFEAGLVSFLDVVDAERTRLETERGSNAIRAERLAVSVALAKALGGEWR
jgi:multidrug efflux system outer membrane protein